MIPREFAYEKPASVDDALATLAYHGADARVLAGGQSLLGLLKTRAIAPEVVVDIGGVDAWRDLSEHEDVLTIGALATQREFIESPELKRRFPRLEEDAWLLGDPAIRNRGTMTGALAYADPHGDWPALALVLDARIHMRGATERTIPVEHFLLDAFMTALAPTEVITHVTISMPAAESGLAYRKVHDPTSGLAHAGAAAFVTLDSGGVCTECRVAVTGVSRRAVRATSTEETLRGGRLSASAITHAVERFTADSNARVASEHPADGLARACIHRALTAALERVR